MMELSPLHFPPQQQQQQEQPLFKEGNTYYYKSILPSGPLKTKILNKNYNNEDKKPIDK